MLRGGVFFVDELPLTPSGKVLRRQVRLIATAMYKERHGFVSDSSCT